MNSKYIVNIHISNYTNISWSTKNNNERSDVICFYSAIQNFDNSKVWMSFLEKLTVV